MNRPITTAYGNDFAAWVAVQVRDQACLQCHGGAGYVEESILPRLFRQAFRQLPLRLRQFLLFLQLAPALFAFLFIAHGWWRSRQKRDEKEGDAGDGER